MKNTNIGLLSGSGDLSPIAIETLLDGELNNFIKEVIVKGYHAAGYILADDLIEDLRASMLNNAVPKAEEIARRYAAQCMHLHYLSLEAREAKYKSRLNEEIVKFANIMNEEINRIFLNEFENWRESRKSRIPISNNHVARIIDSYFLGSQLRKDKADKILKYEISNSTFLLEEQQKEVAIKKVSLKYGGKYYSGSNSEMQLKFLEDNFRSEVINEILSNAFGSVGYKVWLGLWKIVNDSGKRNTEPIVLDVAEFNRDYLGYSNPYNTEQLERTSQVLKALRSASLVVEFDKNGEQQQLDIALLHIDWIWSTKKTKSELGQILPVNEVKQVIKKASIQFPFDLYNVINRGGFYYLIDDRILKIESNKYPYAVKIYNVIQQQFRLDPGKIEKSWTTEDLFRLLTIDPKADHFNISQTYQRIKKDCDYLVKDDFFKSVNIEETENKLLLHRWFFTLITPDRNRLDNIHESHLLLKEQKKKEREKLFSPDDIAKIIDDSGSTMVSFAAEIKHDKGDLSKVLNSKKRVSKGLNLKVIKWLKNREENPD